METQTTSDKMIAPQRDVHLGVGHKVSQQSALEVDSSIVNKMSAISASTTQCTEFPTVGENPQDRTRDTKVISSDASKPVPVCAPHAKVFLIQKENNGVVGQASENCSVKHIFVQEPAEKGSKQVVARLVPAVIQTSDKNKTPLYVLNLSGKQCSAQHSKTEKQYVNILDFNEEKSKISHKDKSAKIPCPDTFDERCRAPQESSVPVIESVFSLQNQYQNVLKAKKKAVIVNPPTLKSGTRVYIAVPEAGSNRSTTSTLHEHTLYRMGNIDFTRKDRKLKSIFLNLSVNRPFMSFRELTEMCYALVKDHMKDLALLDRCEMLLTMRRFVEEFDRFCEIIHPAMMMAMSVYLPDAKDYRVMTWHGIPPLGWRSYSITVIMREVFAIVVQLCCGGTEVPPLDSCYFVASSEYVGKLKLREAVFTVPKGKENGRNSASVWGIKSGLLSGSETLKTRASPAMPSGSCRNTNGVPISSTSAINTVDSPGEMSSPAPTDRAPQGTAVMDTQTVTNEVTLSCNKPVLNQMSPTALSIKDSQKHGCAVIGESSNLEQIQAVPNVAETQTFSKPLISPVTGDSSKDTANLVTPKNLPGAGNDATSTCSDVKVANNSETNADHKVADKLKGVKHSRLFHAMWFNVAPEECQLEIPDAGMCSLSKYLEEKPLESVAPPKGTVLFVDEKKYDANQVLSEFRRGVVYGRMSKNTFTDEHVYQTYASVRVLPDLMPFQATQAGINRAAGMLHEDFSDQALQGKGRPRRTLKGIWPLNDEHCGHKKTGTKRSAPTMKTAPTKVVKTVVEKLQRTSDNGNNFAAGTCKVEPMQVNTPTTADSSPTESRQMINGSAKNEIFAQLVAAITSVTPRLENRREDSENATSMVTSLRQTADFLYQTAAEIEKRLCDEKKTKDMGNP